MKSTFFRVILTALLLSALQLSVNAQKLSPGPQVLTFHSDVDDTEQPYGLYLPPNYNPKKKYPLVVMLHGAGSNHRLGLRRVFGKSNAEGESDVEASRYFPEWKDVNYIVISAFARGTMGYQGVAEKDVMDMLADAKKRFSIDENRTYLTGYSMGGGGTMWVGLSRPDIWAAIAPVCPAPPAGTLEMVPNAISFPVHFFQGDEDQAVKADSTRKWVQRFKDAGAKVEYTEYPGVKHNSWENAYKDGFIFDWFAQFKRNPYPKHVRLATSQYKHNQAYWVTFEGFTPGSTAFIDATFIGTNKIEITAKGLKAFTLNLNGHPDFKAKSALELVINGQTLKTNAGATVTLSENNNSWSVGTLNVSGLAKKQGAEGPMSEVIASRHIYVYGTGGSPSADELSKRRAEAQKAMDWSVYRGDFLGRVMVFPRLLSDKELRPSDIESSNLVLFGTRETNSLIEKYGDKLPIELKASTTDYGLAYVFPVGNRYVLVNSGLPWWTFPENPNAPMSRQNSPAPMNVVGRFQDFVLFKGAINNVVAEGRFNNDWTIPAKEADKMKSSGVVIFK